VQQLQTKAAAKNLTIRLEAVPQGSTLGNEAQLTQVIYNLVDNAVNYTSEGEVVVRVEEGPQEVTLSVTDTGMGIPAEHLDRIFERFYRVDKGRSRATGGTGLGLAIVRHIVESHQGSIQVTSEEGRGTTFTVNLPRLFPFQPLSD
jgi:two-component system phosphate regulon sensor histidine kinase PhoR